MTTDREQLRLWFSDFWHDFKPHDNFFINLLVNRYDVVLDSKNPDALIYSCFGHKHHQFNAIKFFYTGERISPCLTECDYAFSFDPTCGRNYRLPLFLLYNPIPNLLKPKPPFRDYLKQNRKFCNFVYSNPRCEKRNRLFHKLNAYRQVDSGGRFMNNIGGPVDDKLKFLSQYKFTIAFENESWPGYTTEKICEPMTVQSLPIYWGNPLINDDFNTRSFLNAHEFPSEDALIQRIIELDQNDDLYHEYYCQPYWVDGKIPAALEMEGILQFFDGSLKSGKQIELTSSATLLARRMIEAARGTVKFCVPEHVIKRGVVGFRQLNRKLTGRE